MSLATKTILKIQAQPLDAFSLQAGYGVIQTTGERVFYPIGVLEKENYNDKGRCTYARYRYADDSCLEYRYHETRGYTLAELREKEV